MAMPDSFNWRSLWRDATSIMAKSSRRRYALIVCLLAQSRPMNPDCINTHATEDRFPETSGARIYRQSVDRKDLSSIGIVPDATLPVGLAYNHRHTSDADIYFISNQTDTAVTFPVSFRARQISLSCQPMNGEVRGRRNNQSVCPCVLFLCRD